MIEIIVIFMYLSEELWMALYYWDLLHFVKNIVFFVEGILQGGQSAGSATSFIYSDILFKCGVIMSVM